VSRRDPTALKLRVLLHRDMRNAGMEMPLNKKDKAAFAAFERAEKRRERDEFLRSAGLDPRPPRWQGKAVKSIDQIEERLNRAISAEDFELAAALRDELNMRKGQAGAT
jgi:hypothetical protein